jgi:Domain of unknown function (DUF4278)
MHLYYRGIPYSPADASIASAEGQAIGKYRGAPLRSTALVEPNRTQALVKLAYRGIAYLELC